MQGKKAFKASQDKFAKELKQTKRKYEELAYVKYEILQKLTEIEKQQTELIVDMRVLDTIISSRRKW